MPLRLLKAGLVLATPLLLACQLALAADDSRPVCSSQNQGRMWPEAANHDPKLISRLVRCGELFLCVRGTWHYHWEAPSVRFDQLGHQAKSKTSKPSVCEVQSAVGVHAPDPAASDGTE
jgi:hypothetical protein